MLCEFENKVLDFIRSEQLFVEESKVLVAVSGGADSIALLRVLWLLKADRYINAQLICAHLNHQLRGSESRADEAFVVSQAAQLGVDIVTRRLDVKRYAAERGLSVEAAGRKWRIETLREIAEQDACECIATGHHKNDNAETIVQKLLRGTGFRGLAGIRPRRRFENGACFVRPLLCVTRDEIQQYLSGRGVRWREDSSNRELEFRRNFIRHRLLPEIQKDSLEPIVEQLWQLSRQMRKFQDYLDRQVELVWHNLAEPSRGRVGIDLPGFRSQPDLIKTELIRRALCWLGSGEGDLTEGHFQRVIDLANQNISNRILELPDGFRLWREYRRLIFAAPGQGDANEELVPGQTVELRIPGSTCFGDSVIEAKLTEYSKTALEGFKAEKDGFVEWFDYDRLALPLAIRFRRDGDKFIPLGMKTEKKVGQFLTDAQIPQDIRNKVLIVSDAEKIIWVWPIRISDQAKVIENTKRILELRVRPSS